MFCFGTVVFVLNIVIHVFFNSSRGFGQQRKSNDMQIVWVSVSQGTQWRLYESR